ncbi:MAG: hypothetical protein ABUT20_28415 [Bacteroidota bacterium]
MKVTATHNITGDKIPGYMLFINHESDGGSASLQTTIDNLEMSYTLNFENVPKNPYFFVNSIHESGIEIITQCRNGAVIGFWKLKAWKGQVM